MTGQVGSPSPTPGGQIPCETAHTCPTVVFQTCVLTSTVAEGRPQLPQTAFSVSGLLEQAEAQIYFHPEAPTLAVPSSTRGLLSPSFRIYLFH